MVLKFSNRSVQQVILHARTGAFKEVLNNIDTISKELSEISENSSELNHANFAEGLLERHTSIYMYVYPSESISACALPMLYIML